MEITVITYGAGEILDTTFNAIAALMNAKSGTLYQPLVRFSLILGLMWAIVTVIYGNHSQLLTSWFIPFNLMLYLFFIPTCTVIIQDPVTGFNYKVDNVPWGLGSVAGLVSQIGDRVTREVEKTFSLPDDLKYHKTGAVMASNLIANANNFQITDADLNETMRSFVNQCVVYDALMGQKYTLEELRSSGDIWGLVSKNASQARAFVFKAPGKNQRPEILTCAQGVTRLKPFLESSVENAFQFFGRKIFSKDAAKPWTVPLAAGANAEAPASANRSKLGQQLKGYLPGAMNYMTNMSNSANDYMMQQMMIHSVVDGIESQSTALGNAPNFAVRRAYLHQRANEENIAGVAAQKLIAMKNVMEALIYVAFIFLLPLAILPMGWRYIGKWVSLVMWIQLWPPLYAILNFIMNVSVRAKGMGLVATDGTGITIANSVGFSNLHADMAAQAGFMSLAVGSLAYALVKGGAGSFVHLASHMAGPASSASARASEDMMSGNYSLGNISQGTMQANNTTFGQNNMSPSYSSGSFAQNDGVVSRTTAADGEHIVSVANSSLRSSLNMGETMSNSYTEQATKATQMSESQMIASAKSLADHNRQVMDLSNQQSKQTDGSESYSNGVTSSQNKAFTELDGLVDSFASERQISKEKAAQLLASASAGVETGVGFQVFGNGATAKASLTTTATSSYNTHDRDNMSAAQNFSKQNNFQNALNNAAQASQDSRFSESSQDAKKFSSSIGASLEQSNQFRDEASANLQKSQSFSKMASWTKQNSASINASLNQDFVNWLPNQSLPNSSGSMGQVEAEAILSSRPELEQAYQQRFMESKLSQLTDIGASGLPGSMGAIQSSFNDARAGLPNNVSDAPMQNLSTQANNEGMGGNFLVDTRAKHASLDKLNDIQDQMIEHSEKLERMGKEREGGIRKVIKN
ncbi:MAG: conjugal transfer protein TraG N-terminal domain-containing protein [Alphaproteobacteria bacterium]|nr:conjugal transfer protein TraG N-terminal domain-containing protein [Alphaproteobacteria bacterium]